MKNKKHISSSKDRFHHDIAGKDLLSSSEHRFKEYRLKWEENPRNLSPGKFPLHLDIEATSFCNLKCTFCATTFFGSKVENGFMQWQTVKKILDEAARGGVYSCKFNVRGEPLLHPELGRFIRYAKKKGIIDVFFNTNATLLTEERAKVIVDSGLDRITVSIDGFKKGMYEKNRIGARFEEVVANIERLRLLRDKSGSRSPQIRIQAVLTPELENRIPEFIAFWKGKADQVSYNEILNFLPKKISLNKSSWICPYPYQRLAIMWDGTITTCSSDFFCGLSMGNIHSVTLSACWNSSIERLRNLHKAGRVNEIEVCCKCPIRIIESKKINGKTKTCRI